MRWKTTSATARIPGDAVTNAEFMARYPCWCGREAVEVLSKSTVEGVVRTEGFCEWHCEKSHVVVDRRRVTTRPLRVATRARGKAQFEQLVWAFLFLPGMLGNASMG